MLVLDIALTVCIGLLIGTEFAVSVFINPILSKLDEAAQSTATRLFAIRLGKSMPFWYAASLLLLIAESILRRHESGVMLLIIASTIWAVVIVLTLIFLVPINDRMMQLNAGAFPSDAMKAHDRWDMLHRIRVGALTAAMICCLLAIYR
jgi:uncharacterized membrane protein